MKNFSDTVTDELKFALSLLKQVESNEVIEMTDLTRAIDMIMSKYHNQLCEPNAYWVTPREIEILPKLLRLLANGIEQIEEIQNNDSKK